MTSAKASKRGRPQTAASKRSAALIGIRHQPTQGRAKQTVDVILETAAQLLEETGLEAFNTNVLAKRAGVRVRSVYRYFPNKLAVMAALWTKMVGEWDDVCRPGLAKLADPAVDVTEGYETLIQAYMNWLSHRRGAWAVRDTIRAVPELKDQDRSAEEWVVNRCSNALKRRGIGLPLIRLKMICTVVYRAGNAVLHTDFVYYGRPRKAILEELTHMMNPYLSGYSNKNR